LRAWSVLIRHRLAAGSLAVILVLIIVAVAAPVIAPHDPADQNLSLRLRPPSLEYPIGTDQYGRDLLSRLIYGTTISLSVAVVAVTILIGVGTLLGGLAGYFGGAVDMLIMRFVDVMLSLPNFFLLVAIVALFGPSLVMTMLVIGLTTWMPTARLVRGQFLQLRGQEYIHAARAAGASDRRIIWRHLLPNTLPMIIVQASLYTSYAILIEASLSFLGLGAQPPTPSWGNMLNEGKAFMRTAWWVMTFPGMAIFVTVLAFNLLGDGLREALDPRLRGR
jgi:ABC-type dipeptide/oligopeptide/nickel transport system permease subunit